MLSLGEGFLSILLLSLCLSLSLFKFPNSASIVLSLVTEASFVILKSVYQCLDVSEVSSLELGNFESLLLSCLTLLSDKLNEIFFAHVFELLAH